MQNILSIKFRFVDVGNALEMWVALETFMIRSVNTYIYQCMDATKDFDSCNQGFGFVCCIHSNIMQVVVISYTTVSRNL